MKVILTQNIDKIGKAGDVVMVKEGFARNYLIPNNMARIATAGNMKAADAIKKKLALEEEKKIGEAKALAVKISNLSVTLNAAAGEEDKLFGSVTAEMVSEALKNEGYSIDRKDIIIDEPIKKLGTYQIVVKILPEVKANLRIWVVKQ